MRFSARLHDELAAFACTMDVERLSVADVWRSVGAEAERLGLFRPGYHAVLGIVLEERKRRQARREAIVVAADEIWGYTGIDYARLAEGIRSTRRT